MPYKVLSHDQVVAMSEGPTDDENEALAAGMNELESDGYKLVQVLARGAGGSELFVFHSANPHGRMSNMR